MEWWKGKPIERVIRPEVVAKLQEIPVGESVPHFLIVRLIRKQAWGWINKAERQAAGVRIVRASGQPVWWVREEKIVDAGAR